MINSIPGQSQSLEIEDFDNQFDNSFSSQNSTMDSKSQVPCQTIHQNSNVIKRCLKQLKNQGQLIFQEKSLNFFITDKNSFWQLIHKSDRQVDFILFTIDKHSCLKAGCKLKKEQIKTEIQQFHKFQNQIRLSFHKFVFQQKEKERLAQEQIQQQYRAKDQVGFFKAFDEFKVSQNDDLRKQIEKIILNYIADVKIDEMDQIQIVQKNLEAKFLFRIYQKEIGIEKISLDYMEAKRNLEDDINDKLNFNFSLELSEEDL